jgi:hypothetical protein
MKSAEHIKIPLAIIHIGLEKTGSTSVQSNLMKNKHNLINDGYYYYHDEKKINCRKLVSYFSEYSLYDDYLNLNNINNYNEKNEHFYKYNKYLDSKINAARKQQVHTVIFSSEHFHSQLFGDLAFSKMHEWFYKNFENVKIIMSIRDQKETVVSLYSTALLCGYDVDPYIFIEKWYNNFTYCSHLNIYKRWSKYNDVHVINYSKELNIINMNIIDKNKIDKYIFYKNNKKLNKSITELQYRILRFVNKIFPRFQDGKHISGTHILGRFLRRAVSMIKFGNKWTYTGDFDKKIANIYQEESRELSNILNKLK